MLARCYQRSDQGFRHYGGRGIKVCTQWRGKNGFATFLADMGTKPGPNYSIDRINNDGNYEPGNCQWATQEQQSNNTRRNIRVECNGKKQTLSQWARESGISRQAIDQRIKNGWSPQDAVVTPAGTRGQGRLQTRFKIGGEPKRVRAAAKTLEKLVQAISQWQSRYHQNDATNQAGYAKETLASLLADIKAGSPLMAIFGKIPETA